MIRMLMALVILISTTMTSANATSDLTREQFLQGTGSSCLAGGILVGLAALAAGPAVATAMATPVASTSLTAGSATLIGCGATAAVAVTYYGATWIYGTLFGEPRYPLLYPPMERR